MYGGTNDKDNLVDLTPEEHYVAHQLLVKIYPGNQGLIRAVHCMSSSSYKNPRNNKSYGWIRRKFAENNSGIGNSMSKLSESDVIEIYRSCDHTKDLMKKYGISGSQILSVKRKKSYKSILNTINELPGVHPSIKRIPLSDDLIRQIYLDTGTPKFFKEKYHLGINAIRHIKEKHTYKDATKELKRPGQIAIYGLFPHDVFAIKNSKRSVTELAKSYDVTVGTIQNIQKNRTRHFTDILY